MNDHKDKIRAFFSRFFRTTDLNDADDIFALGFVNSLFAMQLVMWLEKEFSITITETDLDIKNFNTIDAIAALIGRKTVAAMAAV